MTRKGTSTRMHYDPYSYLHPDDMPSPGMRRSIDKYARPSWRRLWTVVLKEHRFVGGHLYAALAHLLAGVSVWAAGVYVDSLALMCYAFIVIFDAISLLIDVVPRLLEYSNNNHSSLAYPFGQQAVPTVFRFTNSLVLLYRSVQALKEGVEHIVIRGHQHGVAGAGEFESYARTGDSHGKTSMLAPVCIAAAMAATVYSAARHANHRLLWEMRVGRDHRDVRPLQNALINPYNVASLCAGLWMMVAMAMAPADTDDSALEPVSCIAVSLAMAYISFPTCVQLGKALLLSATPETAASMRGAVDRVRRLSGVAECSDCYVWNVAQASNVAVLRVGVEEPFMSNAGRAALLGQISTILKAAGLESLAIEIHTVPGLNQDLCNAIDSVNK
ncbi:hypothetical protein LPJ56_002296 [Coemansia sp. RSA 2599]|nr:hypothetical protein LPJ75_001965 [Coemansia sp. RSA 2598]KAJ1826215.1 hypothetical protein LPJ56_002296 [Coemansia sp. RSA 2599]